MDENKNTWLQELKKGDRVHIHNRRTSVRTPVAAGRVEKVDRYTIKVRADDLRGWDNSSLFSFNKWNGAQEDTYGDAQILASLGICPYSDEQELARRETKEKAQIIGKLKKANWQKLSLDALEEICAILRENEVNV